MRPVLVLALLLAAGCSTPDRPGPPTPLEQAIMEGDSAYVAAHAEARRTRPGWQPVLQSALDTTAQACPEQDPSTSMATYGALLASGASINQPVMVRNEQESLPLVRAAFYCQPEVVAYLIEAGGRVNAAPADGRTPLMSAAHAYYGNIARKIDVLLAAGANAGARDAEGRTALDYALANRRVREFPEVLADLMPGEAGPRPVAEAAP